MADNLRARGVFSTGRSVLHGYLFVLPCVLLMVLVLGFPLAAAVANSFTPLWSAHKTFTLRNYVKLFHDTLFWNALRVTGVFVGSTVGLHFLIGFAVALALNASLRGRKVLRLLAILPWTVPDVISGLIWRFMYDPTAGIINDILMRCGLAADYIEWLARPGLALPSVVLADVWRGYPFVMVILLAGLQAIPKELSEAARVDGASRIQELVHVTIPGLLRIMLIALALDTIWQIRRFGLVYNMTLGGPGHVTEILMSRGTRSPNIGPYVIIAFVCLFNVVPFFWMIATSFKTYEEAYRIPPTYLPKEPTLESYAKILLWTHFPRYFLNSTVVSLGTAFLSTFVGALAGYGFSRFRFPGRTTLIGVVLATQMLPGVLLVGPYFKMLVQIRLYNTYPGLILAFTTITLPFSTWMMKGFIDTVPEELDQAALVDGCSALRGFCQVILPVITPGMVATMIFAFLLAWGDLLWVLVLTSGESMATVTLGLSRLVTQFRIIWPQLMAGSVVASVPPLVLYLVLEDYLVKGLTAGAVKE